MKITKTDSTTISQIIESANLYQPTVGQRQVKAEFQAALADGPSPEKVTAPFAVQITGRSVIEKWWGDEKFRRWFLDNRTFETEAEALASAALGVVGDIMFQAPKDGDRLSAAKLLIEVAGKIKKAQVEVKYLDESIPDDPAKLDEYIAKATGGIDAQTGQS